VRSLVCSSDGRWIASGSNDSTVKVWDVDSARELYSLQKHTGPIVALAFSPDGRWLASGSVDKTIRIWDLKTGSDIKTLNKHTAPLSVLTFSKSGDALVSAAGTEVISWETKTWTDKQTFRRNAATVTALAFGNDETTIASAASDGSVLLWRIGSDRERFVLKHNLSVALAIVFTNDSLMAIHADGGIDTWDLEKGIPKKSLPGDANRQQLAFAVWSSDGSIFASTTICWPPEVEVVKLRFGTSITAPWLTVCPHRPPALTTLRLVRPENCLQSSAWIKKSKCGTSRRSKREPWPVTQPK
jgi:WD40 repeat protein